MWEHKSLQPLLSIRSASQALGRAMYRLAKCTQLSWQCPARQWAWKVILRPQQREAPDPPRPITMQLTPFAVAVRLMSLLWPGPDTPIQYYPHLTEEEMPGIQRCCFGTLPCLQQSDPHVVELT